MTVKYTTIKQWFKFKLSTHLIRKFLFYLFHTRTRFIASFKIKNFNCRNSESNHNYVDRVRIRDPAQVFGGPGRGSGWRQKSFSSIDLTTNKSGINSQDYSGLYDLYSRIEHRKDYEEELYGTKNPEGIFYN